ncbi:MAG: hypothetical protein IJO50_04170 [Clostridia bacterium]|nr:hypothetical protein [Clostridia bacterium]
MNYQNVTLAKERAQAQYDRARSNLLLMIILTMVNVGLAIAESYTMMLFSATVPYYVVIFGFLTYGTTLATVCFVVAALCMLGYLLCWNFSKTHYGWMIGALVMFILDTLFLVYILMDMQDASNVIDILIHIWVLYYLVIGVVNGHRLKKLSDVVPVVEEETDENIDTKPLYMADTDCKSRTLLETDFEGRHISYRRVKRTNELVIDGYVYQNAEMLIEPRHFLSAKLDGHEYQVGYDGLNSYIMVDGTRIAKKLRLW